MPIAPFLDQSDWADQQLIADSAVAEAVASPPTVTIDNEQEVPQIPVLHTPPVGGGFGAGIGIGGGGVPGRKRELSLFETSQDASIKAPAAIAIAKMDSPGLLIIDGLSDSDREEEEILITALHHFAFV